MVSICIVIVIVMIVVVWPCTMPVRAWASSLWPARLALVSRLYLRFKLMRRCFAMVMINPQSLSTVREPQTTVVAQCSLMTFGCWWLPKLAFSLINCGLWMLKHVFGLFASRGELTEKNRFWLRKVGQKEYIKRVWGKWRSIIWWFAVALILVIVVFASHVLTAAAAAHAPTPAAVLLLVVAAVVVAAAAVVIVLVAAVVVFSHVQGIVG